MIMCSFSQNLGLQSLGGDSYRGGGYTQTLPAVIKNLFELFALTGGIMKHPLAPLRARAMW